jgi:hypothetical protein
LNEKKRTVSKFYTGALESLEHVRFFTAKNDY